MIETHAARVCSIPVLLASPWRRPRLRQAGLKPVELDDGETRLRGLSGTCEKLLPCLAVFVIRQLIRQLIPRTRSEGWPDVGLASGPHGGDHTHRPLGLERDSVWSIGPMKTATGADFGASFCIHCNAFTRAGRQDLGRWHEPGRVLPGSHPGAHLKSVITSGHVIGLAPSEICVPSGTVDQYSVRNAAAATSLISEG